MATTEPGNPRKYQFFKEVGESLKMFRKTVDYACRSGRSQRLTCELVLILMVWRLRSSSVVF